MVHQSSGKQDDGCPEKQDESCPEKQEDNGHSENQDESHLERYPWMTRNLGKMVWIVNHSDMNPWKIGVYGEGYLSYHHSGNSGKMEAWIQESWSWLIGIHQKTEPLSYQRHGELSGQCQLQN
jgi:hypothetical protein